MRKLAPIGSLIAIWDACGFAGRHCGLSDFQRNRGAMSGESETASLEGKYANFFKVGHNAFEFILDFGQSFVETSRETFHTRIITSPVYAKELLEVLQDSVAKHERMYGEIRLHEHES